MATNTGSKEKMEAYAVVDGFGPAPGIFSSWGHVHPLVTGYKKAKFQKFATILEAEMHMEKNGVKEYIKIIKPVSAETTLVRGKKAYYAVANGRSPGVQEWYFGDAGTELEVVKFSGACHKRFSNLTSAEDFIADWVEMYSAVCKELIKQELSRGFRPLSMDGPPVSFVRETERTSIEGSIQLMLSEMRV